MNEKDTRAFTPGGGLYYETNNAAVAAGRNNSAERKAITAAKWLYSRDIRLRFSPVGRRLNKRMDAIVSSQGRFGGEKQKRRDAP